ncbi:Nance-Horan syndrome protein isoform X4 [Pygocentrus nattereri]|uniref:Nance-Horan syndrome protein isoform X4 n=1 Tax=Pygocentrus nattereri TaxID=42514 RepID=UPI001890BD13|nr:Nance-Horan syndrome protein isoform X4 [Pygocentrus nattereri]
MPFSKRAVEPRCVWRSERELEQERERGSSPDRDLRALCGAALACTLRQLADVARHAGSVFEELEEELARTEQRLRTLRETAGRVQRHVGQLEAKQEAVPVSNLDIESKLTAHYQSVFHLQRNVFLPSTRPACVEELHRNAKQSLQALYRDQQQRQEVSDRERRRVTISISAAPPIPAHPSPQSLRNQDHLHTERTEGSTDTHTAHAQEEEVRDAAVQVEHSQAVDDPDSEGMALGLRSKCPIPNVPSTLDKQTNWSGVLPLPTPEDRMKSHSQAIGSCVVPINVTEEVSIAAPSSAISAFLRVGFDRDASVRCSLVHSQSVLQRRRKLRRRKTITGIPRRVQPDLDSDESPVARERTVIVHASPDTCQEDLILSRLNTRDSGCQTDDLLIVAAAPSRRRIRAQRGQCGTVSLSHSTGNISSLPESSETMFAASIGSRLRSRSLPREGGRLVDEGHNGSDEDEDEDEDEELSPFEAEDFLAVQGEHMLKDEGESTDDQVPPERQLGSLKFKQLPESPEHVWMDRGRSHLPHKADMESCEISSSSDTFSSPIHSNPGILTSQMDHKEDHQSSSGNWSGSSSTCPSQTSETIPPAASPPLTGSSHCDSELSLNAAPNANEDSTGFIIDPYSGDRLQGLRGHRTGSFTSTATDMLDDAGVSTASEGEWSYPQHRHSTSCHQGFSPEHSREEEGSLECPSFASIATIESLDKPPSEKADTMSHFSVDAEGYYTSMHFDCGLKGSKSFTYNYASVDQQKEDYRGHSLGRRSLSLRKPKVKPSPPKRSSSLKKISSHVGPALETNEPKITGEQHLPMSSKEKLLQMRSNDPSDQLESEEPVEAWGVQCSSEIPDIAYLGSTDTHSFKDEGAVQSDYADLWLLNDLKSNDPYRSLSNSSTATGTTVIECIKSQESSESQTSQSGSRATTPSLPPVENEFRLPSPEKLVGLASPSSGYSSQSETPTSSMPSAFFTNPNPISPTGGKRKPKVPERKSSLASLQQRSSKRDLELPIIPPTHLDLSGLHSVNKPSTHRNQMHIFHQNKQKVAAAKAEAGASLAAKVEPDSTGQLVITPMVLRSVQLRSVGKPGEENHDQPCTDASTRPKCPTVTIVTEPTNSKPHETRKPPPYRPLTTETSSKDNCESLLTLADGPASGSLASLLGARNRYDRLAPVHLSSLTAFSATSEEGNQDDITADISEDIVEQKVSCDQETSTSKELSPQNSLEAEKGQPGRSEATEENTAVSPSDHHGIVKTSESLDKVPDFMNRSSLESLQINPVSDASNQGRESLTSGVPARSASQDNMEEGLTPDTEGYFSKESTPSDPTVSPQMDEDVFLSPSKARTTEDLFAMIHRSKRKVLGRKDSGDMAGRGRLSAASSPLNSPSTPVTPATPTSSQRAPGPIYRSVKKSSTSNEEFKQLLLKKGSRSDSSYRMSATEILKSPIASKSFSDSLAEGSKQPDEFPSPLQLQSPEGTPEQFPSPFPKVSVEGFTTKVFPTGSSRPGRSRIPPASNSSRYSTRSRLYTAPMQAISEGETENSDGSPHDDRSS